MLRKCESELEMTAVSMIEFTSSDAIRSCGSALSSLLFRRRTQVDLDLDPNQISFYACPGLAEMAVK